MLLRRSSQNNRSVNRWALLHCSRHLTIHRKRERTRNRTTRGRKMKSVMRSMEALIPQIFECTLFADGSIEQSLLAIDVAVQIRSNQGGNVKGMRVRTTVCMWLGAFACATYVKLHFRRTFFHVFFIFRQRIAFICPYGVVAAAATRISVRSIVAHRPLHSIRFFISSLCSEVNVHLLLAHIIFKSPVCVCMANECICCCRCRLISSLCTATERSWYMARMADQLNKPFTFN